MKISRWKKSGACCLAILLALSMTACGSQAKETGSSGTGTAAGDGNDPSANISTDSASAGAAGKESAGAYASWPEETVSLYVPVSAGGNVDAFARIDADYFTRSAGQTMIVENLNTGGGILCYETVRGAEPDGYKLMMYNSSLFTSYYTGSYEHSPLENFTPICTLQDKGGSAICVRSDSPYQTLEDLVKAAAENPGTIKFGMSAKSAAEFIVKLLEKDSGCEFKSVDAGNNGDRITSLLGGMIDVCTLSISSAMQYSESGDFRVLCITDEQRSEYAPDVPTAVELGYSSVIYGSQSVLYGPAGMDPELAARISQVFSGIVDDASAMEQSDDAAAPIKFRDGKDTKTFVEEEDARMKVIADMLGYEYGK